MRWKHKTQKGTQSKQRKGFSLVELVVVIIIIAILAVAIFAGGSIAIKKAQISRAKSDLHNFDVAIQSYMFSDRKPVGLSRSSTDAEYLTVVNGLNKNLPKDYVLQATGLSADGKISTALDHKYVYDSDKKDPWGNPYYFLVDPQARNDGETEYFFTVLTAGPNAKATVGGAVDKDDIFLLCQYSNSAVVSQTYSMSSDKKDATGTPLTAGTTILVSPDGTSAPRNIGAARSGPGAGGPGGEGSGSGVPEGVASGNFISFSSPSTFSIGTYNSAQNWNGTIEYSTDAASWDTWDGTEIPSSDNGAPYTLYIRGTRNSVISSGWNGWTVNATHKIRCDGNIENILDYETVVAGDHPTMEAECFLDLFDGFENGWNCLTKAPDMPAPTLSESCYEYMFSGCESLTAAPELPATTLADNCYSEMFSGCTSLTTAPELPATTLAVGCYDGMFLDCTNLTSFPELPVTTLKDNCYDGMFSGCTSLTAAPELPATTLAASCYAGMFYGCESLTAAPELPATTLAARCYEAMFQGCRSLTAAPELPVTTLADYCYEAMFCGCTSLTAAPELPATTLAPLCYSNMFNGCTGFTTAPELPATTLASSCYNAMFFECTNLTTAPELPATTLANYCYGRMFSRCTSLTTAPELPATTLAKECYHDMFNGCTSLTAIPALHATSLEEDCYERMFYNCTSIKISASEDDEYATTYRIPPTGTATAAYSTCYEMFEGSGGTFTGTPYINKTYYLHKDNLIVPAS